MKILLIRFGAIGDLVLLTPLVRCLRKAFPGATLHLLTGAAYAHVLQSNPYLDGMFTTDGFNAAMLSGYTHLIDLQNDEASRRLTKGAKLPVGRVPQRRFRKFIFTNLRWKVMPQEHQVDRYFEAARVLDLRYDGEGLDFPIPSEAEVPQQDIPTSHQLGFVALVIGGSAATKRLPVAQLRALCESIRYPVILLGGREDAARGEAIRQADEGKVYNACGKFSLAESADLLRKAKLVVTHDTGLMHIAAALEKKLVVIWGSTVPSLGMTPFYPQACGKKGPAPAAFVQVEKLWCRPCTVAGRDSCPQGHFKCMKNIAVAEIAALVKSRLIG